MLKDGKGTFELTNGDKMEGTWKHDYLQGVGIKIYK